MSDDWDEKTTTAQSFSFGGGGDVSSSDDSGFGSKSNGFGGGDGGFGKPSRGFGGRGRGSSGFGGREESNGFGDFEDKSSGFVGNKGFGSGRGGFKGRHRDDREDGESSGFGGGRGGGRGGFRGRRYDNENSENGESGRFGGGRSFGGSRDGFRGRPRDNENGDDGGSGFGGGTGFGGGRGGFRGRRRDNENGDDGSNGFGGGGGFGGSRSGFSGRRRDDNNEDSEGGGGGGKGFSGRGHNNEEDGGQDGEGRRRELYIPPAPPEDEDKLFETMAVGINFEKYDEIPVEVTGRDPPQYISTFDECDFFETTRKNIERCNYTRPTPVQKYAIPIIGTGRDLMACAQTGSGKTAAFLLPVITKLVRENLPGASAADSQSPEVLIISPTRELTLQIYNEARKFVHSSIYRPVVVYGGTSVGHQLRQLEMGCNILVATPGRLVDFLNRKKVLLDNLKVLILDEADRMLDMGFEPEIRKVVDQFNMPDKISRQTLMFSATFPEDIQRLAGDFLNDHIFLTVGVVGGTTSDIQQRVVEVGDSDADKREKLQEILLESGTNRVLVFVETKRNADFLASLLCQENFPTTSIHGDRFQREREEALRDFRSGRSRVLVATSVAARGLDIPKVKHVINYDLPSSIDEYVHRIGRTGRIGNQGQATAFFQSHRDGALARALVKVLADAHQEVPEFLEQAAVAAVGTNYGPAGGKFASKDIRFQGSGRRGGNGGFKGDSSGFGNDDGGFGTGFEESSTGHFSSQPAVTEEEDW